MDKELEQNVKDLERGYELKQEEAMHGERVGQTLEMNEELEDKLELIKKLRKQLKLTRGTSIGVLAVLVLVLLYACVTYIMHPSQTVTEKTITYNLEVPKPDMSQVESITLDELMGTLEHPLDYVDYLGSEYKIGSNYPSGVILYPELSIEKAFYETKRIYTMDSEAMTCTEHDYTHGKDSTAWYYDKIVFNGEGAVDIRAIEHYVNIETYKSGDASLANKTNHYGHEYTTIKLSVYEEVDIDIGSFIKGVLESFDYAEVMSDENIYAPTISYNYKIAPEKLAEEIAAGLTDIEFSLNIGDFFYGTYDSVEEQDEYIVCFRDGEKYIPEAVTKYNIKVTDYRYSLPVCAVQSNWFSSSISSQSEQESVEEQEVYDETLTFVMEVPEIDMSQVKSITLDELMATLSTRKDKVVYLGKAYKQDDEYPSGVILYSAETVEKAFASARRTYTLNGEIMECTHHPQGILPGCFVRRYLDADIPISVSYVYYYNDAVLRENTLFKSWAVPDVPNHYGHKEWGIKLGIYGKTDVDVSSLIKNTLESLPFARFLPSSDGYAANDIADHYRFGVDPERVAKSIINGLSDVEFSLEVESPSKEYEDYFYSTDGIESTEAVTNYNIKVVDYDYKSWICGVQEHWFE